MAALEMHADGGPARARVQSVQHREMCESRGSRTGGEIPSDNSTFRPMRIPLCLLGPRSRKSNMRGVGAEAVKLRTKRSW